MALAVELAHRPTFIQRLHAPILLHVAAGGNQVAAEKTPPQQGCGEDLGVGEVTQMGVLRAGEAQKKSSMTQYIATVCSVMARRRECGQIPQI